MKMKKYITIILCATFVLTGCGDFLEPSSKSEFVPDDAVSLNELLLGEAYMRNDMDGFNEFINLLDDDIEAAPYQKPIAGFDGNKYLAAFSWQPDMYRMMEEAGAGIINQYECFYEVILGANAVIDYLPEVSDTEDNMNKVKAQAHALRAFYYFNLVNLYGPPYNYLPDSLGVPLKLNSGIEESNEYLKRKTVKEVYQQILLDLHIAEEAYNALPSDLQWDKNFRASLPMVQLLLSRTYLYMENWEKAAEYAEYVMKDNRFALLDLNTVPLYNGSIRNYAVYSSYSSSETIWPYGSIKDMFQWTHDYANQTTETGRMHAYFKASQSLLDCFDGADLRKSRYIIQAPDNKGSGKLMYMAYGKVNYDTGTFLPQNVVGQFGRCLRLSEAYLNYAEAKAMLGGANSADAVVALNELTVKRFDPEDYEPYEYTTDEELISFVREERRRELCFEGHRWFDLRRWGMPAISHTWYDDDKNISTYHLEERDSLYTLPIPDEALELNASLIQNDLPEKRIPETVTVQ